MVACHIDGRVCVTDGWAGNVHTHSLEIHKHNRAKRETTTLIMRMLMHAVRTSVKPRLTEGGSDVVEHGRGDQLPEGTAARLAAGERIGDLLANEAVKDDFSQTLVVVVGASAIAVVVVVAPSLTPSPLVPVPSHVAKLSSVYFKSFPRVRLARGTRP